MVRELNLHVEFMHIFMYVYKIWPPSLSLTNVLKSVWTQGYCTSTSNIFNLNSLESLPLQNLVSA